MKKLKAFLTKIGLIVPSTELKIEELVSLEDLKKKRPVKKAVKKTAKKKAPAKKKAKKKAK